MGRIIKGRWYKSGGASTVVEVPVPVPAPPMWLSPSVTWVFDAPMLGEHAGSNLYAGNARETARWNHNNLGTITSQGLVFSGSVRRLYNLPNMSYITAEPFVTEIEFDFPTQLRSSPILLTIGNFLLTVGYGAVGGARGLGVLTSGAVRWSRPNMLTFGETYRIRIEKSGGASWSVTLNDVVVGTFTYNYNFGPLSSGGVVVGGAANGAIDNCFTGAVRNVRISHPYVTKSP